MNRLDLEEIAFHQRVRDGYHQMAASDPQRWVIIDAGRSAVEVHSELRSVLLQRLSPKA